MIRTSSPVPPRGSACRGSKGPGGVDRPKNSPPAPKDRSFMTLPWRCPSRRSALREAQELQRPGEHFWGPRSATMSQRQVLPWLLSAMILAAVALAGCKPPAQPQTEGLSSLKVQTGGNLPQLELSQI